LVLTCRLNHLNHLILAVDENVIVGSAPASADKTSITDYGNVMTYVLLRLL
jgi:hypothetical protein